MIRHPTSAWFTTTICSICAVAAAHAWEPVAPAMTELDLLRAFLKQPAQTRAADAGDQLVKAAGTVEPWSLEPTFELRHEQGMGTATAFRTTAVGGSVALDVSGQQPLTRKAARHRAAGVQIGMLGERRASVCEFRSVVLDATHAHARLEVLQRRHDQLAGLAQTVDGLASAGEASTYDGDRLRLQLQTHALDLWRARTDWTASRGALENGAGVEVDQIALFDLPALPALAELRESTLSRHPGLTAAAEHEDAAVLAERAARRAAVPGLGLFGAYRMDAEPGATTVPGFEAGLSVDLPWPGEGRQDATAARAEQARQRATREQNRVALLARLDAAYQLVATADDVPASPPLDLDSMWDASWSRYTAGEGTVTELVDALMSIELQELSGLAQSFDRRRARLELSCLSCAFLEPEVEALIEEMER